MKISCVICHHKGDFILKAIKSILLSRFVEVEIIVATSVAGASFHNTKTVFIHGGPAKKRNIASRFATSDYICFFDDDVEVDRDAIFEMLKVLTTKDDVGMVYGKSLNMEYRDRFDEAGSFLTWTGFLWARAESGVVDRGQFERVEPILAGKSATCMIRKKCFWEVGAFDPSYDILGEETDLSWRLWLSGFRVLFVPGSVTYHAFNTKFKPRDYYTSERIYFNGCRNYLSMLTTNLEIINLIPILAIQKLVWLTSAVGFIMTGNFSAGLNILKGIFYFYSRLNFILHKRHLVQTKRKILDKDLFKIIMKNPPFSYYIGRILRYLKTGLHG